MGVRTSTGGLKNTKRKTAPLNQVTFTPITNKIEMESLILLYILLYRHNFHPDKMFYKSSHKEVKHSSQKKIISQY